MSEPSDITRFLHPTPHPCEPAMEREDILAIADAGDEAWARYRNWFEARERRIALSQTDGFRLFQAYEPECWRQADLDLDAAKTNGRHYGGLFVGGGMRSTKSRWAASRFLRSCLAYGSQNPQTPSVRWVMANTSKNSILTVQLALWEWMPALLRGLNNPGGRRDAKQAQKIRYTPDAGFASESVLLANGSLIMFLTYEADPKDYQGAELGGWMPTPKAWCDRCARDTNSHYSAIQPLGRCPRCGTELTVPIPNLGAWLDEDAPSNWVKTIRDRNTTRSAKFVWTFTTKNGITPAVRDLRGVATDVQTLPAGEPFPQDRVIVPGLPVGHLPYRQVTATPGVRAIYFHSAFNRFGDNWANMLATYSTHSVTSQLCNLAGYSADVTHRAFPLFSSVHIVDECDLPEVGTNYQVIDPAGARNDFMLWARVAPAMGNQCEVYIYRDWPDEQTFGEWFVPDEQNPQNVNGIRGPAQAALGYGVAEYKTEVILRAETIPVPEGILRWLRDHPDQRPIPADIMALTETERDPYRRARLRAAVAAGETEVREHIHRRYLDPRAAGTGDQANKRQKTLLHHYREAQFDALGNQRAPGMPECRAAAATLIRDSIARINEHLYWDTRKPLVRPYNAPRLYVSTRCRQIIAALSSFMADTREAAVDFAERAGAKDVIDTVRYLVSSKLVHQTPGESLPTEGGGSY